MLQSQRDTLTQSILKRLKDKGMPNAATNTQPIDLMGQSAGQQEPVGDQEVDQLGTQLRAPISTSSGPLTLGMTPKKRPKKQTQQADEEDLG